MSLKVATWNINSVRLRIDLVTKLLADEAPDVLCLQETKCPDDLFPEKALHKAGYTHIVKSGQKGYHGVAIVARVPLENASVKQFCGKQDCRHIQATAKGVEIHNFYVPAGGDEPDPVKNEKFAHKLQFLDEMATWFKRAKAKTTAKRVVVGDLNVAPLEHDVWSHKQMLKIVSHTPEEVARFEAVVAAHKWIDVPRLFTPHDEKLYSWWSYRAKDWETSNRGRRLDHIWASPALDGAATGVKTLTHARGWERPSDHAPVIADFAV
ncbi:exodeoxyribonuclease III [Pyruvatibacter sp.]|uniref:exodeoxyribonuclease III n=1 Tax=Pyruvatibacter sp. TaxID=1981328 RepID=UPI0032EABAE8